MQCLSSGVGNRPHKHKAFSRLSSPNVLSLTSWSGLEYFVAAEHHASAFSRANYTDFELLLRVELLDAHSNPLSFAKLNSSRMGDVRLRVEVAAPVFGLQVHALLSAGGGHGPMDLLLSGGGSAALRRFESVHLLSILMVLLSIYLSDSLAAVCGEATRGDRLFKQNGTPGIFMFTLLWIHYLIYHSLLLPQYKGFLLVSHLIVLILQFLASVSVFVMLISLLVVMAADWITKLSAIVAAYLYIQMVLDFDGFTSSLSSKIEII